VENITCKVCGDKEATEHEDYEGSGWCEVCVDHWHVVGSCPSCCKDYDMTIKDASEIEPGHNMMCYACRDERPAKFSRNFCPTRE